ncbi:gag-pol polyprotein [Trifolium medium]|uniref:Gag-pol polyprotein n=1 Tax=Trifolium medium TaxID=97028 RepID=A0A392N2D8_9FABA|nr:gag-pol polyprotein [Trifolium medium]
MGGRSLARKALRLGYYWPTIQEDSKEHPFAWWGMDILEPFTIGLTQNKYLIVGVDYFTKWVEAEPLANISAFNVLCFFKRDILCRFGIPLAAVTDNGTQFMDNKF